MSAVASDHLAIACYMASLPATSLPFNRLGPNDALPLDVPTIFVDAAASVARAGIVIFHARSHTGSMFSFNLPAVLSQQGAELYVTKMPIQMVAGLPLPVHGFKHSYLLVSDNTSALFSLLKMSTKVKFKQRGKILRQVSTACANSKLSFLLGWVGSKLNPADGPSRISAAGEISGQLDSHLLSLCRPALEQVCFNF